MSQNNGNNNGSGKDLTAGLAPAIATYEVGRVYQETTQTFAAKMADEIRSTYGISELDNIIITPRLDRGPVGANDIIAVAYFNTQNGKNVFYRGKGNNKNAGGRLNMVQTAGYGAGGTGLFGTSDDFKKVMKPLCKVDDRGNPLMNLKSVSGVNNVASLELEFMSLLCIFLGIESNDSYDCTMMSVVPIGGGNGQNATGFNMMFMKYVADGKKNRGKSGINYSRIEQETFDRINNGRNNNRGGGRQY